MRIINRYILKEHIGPFVFALSALTSLLLLQVIARRFGDLVGRGLSWQVITEFFLLSIPYTLAMTLPMAVLVAVLHAFTRLASENEITALKAGGVSTRSLMLPSLVAATFLAVFMLWFNDQLLPRTNHRLATLQTAILRTKPTFALRPQVVNTIKEGQLYLRAGQIDESSGLMHDVTIYDLTQNTRRKTIYGDSGTLAFAANRRDLTMHLYHGMMLMTESGKPGELSRVYYREDQLAVKDVINHFDPMNADTTSKGDREMSVCEMQRGFEAASRSVARARGDSIMAMYRLTEARGSKDPLPRDVYPPPTKVGGIGAVYCTLISKYFHVPEAQAAEVPRVAVQQDTTKRDTTKRDSTKRDSTRRDSTKRDSIRRDSIRQDTLKRAAAGTATATPTPPVLVPNQPPAVAKPIVPTPGVATYPAGAPSGATPAPPPAPVPGATLINKAAGTPPSAGPLTSFEVNDAKARLDQARHDRNRYGIEIQKKFSLASACIVFVLVGAPLALRFPRGGVGLVIGASFFIFAVYYVGLIGGESLANKNIISPFWAMWVDNIVFLIIGLALMVRMGNESVTSRGGSVGEAMDATRAWFARQGRRVHIGSRRSAL